VRTLRRVRNKSAVLTKLLLAAVRQHTTVPSSAHASAASTTTMENVLTNGEDTGNTHKGDGWAGDLCYQVAFDGVGGRDGQAEGEAGGEAAQALQDSVFQVCVCVCVCA